MTGGEILTQLSAAGISCRLDGGEIVLSPAERVTDEIKALILAHRAAVVEAIRPAAPARCIATCASREEIDLPRRGPTPGCIIRGKDFEIWRPLHRLARCPRDN